jgi:hypothetical protein
MPNEIVIEAMIKGLRPGPTAQYFTRKPPQTLEKLLQKMDEYIRALPPKKGGSLQVLGDDQGLWRKNPLEACQVNPQLQSE